MRRRLAILLTLVVAVLIAFGDCVLDVTGCCSPPRLWRAYVDVACVPALFLWANVQYRRMGKAFVLHPKTYCGLLFLLGGVFPLTAMPAIADALNSPSGVWSQLLYWLAAVAVLAVIVVGKVAVFWNWWFWFAKQSVPGQREGGLP
jgi:hypothetical protein